MDISQFDRNLISRCLEIAKRGAGLVSPNPLVGAAIVHDRQVIGEGWHKKYGGPHAEVEAVASVTDKSLLSSSTLYVSLEPCCHYGKTPPCTKLILESKIPRVVVAARDPNSLVNGGGIEELKRAGVDVVTGVMEEEARALNRGFFSYHERKRPWVILKWAQTSDGFIAPEDGTRVNISCEESRRLVHQWRAAEDCILVGTRTAELDNPALTVRLAEGCNPIRAVVDRKRRLPSGLLLFDGSVRTLLFTERAQITARPNVEVIELDSTAPLPIQVIEALYERKILTLIVEGGAKLINSFLEANAWDEARIFFAPYKLERGLLAPAFHGAMSSEQTIGTDTLRISFRP